jgi:hypothetical protein
MAAEPIEQCRAIKDALERLKAECRRIESMWWRHRLETAQIPAHRGDGLLVEEFSRYTNASEASMDTIFAEVTGVERIGRALRVSEQGQVTGAMVAGLRKELRTIIGLPLGQMHSRDQAPAGRIEAATIEPDGTVRISALVEYGLAARKTSARVYPGISIRFDGEEIDEVALVDRNFSKLSKGAGAADTVLVKIYSGGMGKMSKSDEGAKRAVEALLNRAIVPDASDAAKRSQAFFGLADALSGGPAADRGRSALHDRALTARVPRDD